jgi:hypothetical protein
VRLPCRAVQPTPAEVLGHTRARRRSQRTYLPAAASSRIRSDTSPDARAARDHPRLGDCNHRWNRLEVEAGLSDEVFAITEVPRIVLPMPGNETIESTLLETEPELDIIDELKSSRPAHPALARLHDRLVGATPEREITSYDRMHHRHNRK